MFTWYEALIVAIIAGVSIIMIIIIIIILIRRNCATNQRTNDTENHQKQIDPKTVTFQSEVNSKRRRRGSSTKSFNWADHPALITDAVENGWSRFGFTTCAGGINQVEESWEIGAGSVDFMQKISFKPSGGGSGGGGGGVKGSSLVAVRMALPLPGPAVVHSFPEEAYFEIRVLNSREKGEFDGEGEKTKLLIQRSFSSSTLRRKSEEGLLFHVSSSRGSHLLEELKFGGGGRRGGGDGGGGGVKMSIGLSVGGSWTSRIPGSYAGSIGFNSDGSVFLGGMKLVFESEKDDWARTGKVIGCGFDPRKKKVYFTVDSELVHVIHCKSEDFGMPLYPILATNIDISVLVNLGQSTFNYPPANAHRTPNPCFIGPLVNSSATMLGSEDSKELFSMGRIDAEWLNCSTTKSTVSNSSSDIYSNTRNSNMDEYEDEPEAEFIEIVLDYNGR